MGSNRRGRVYVGGVAQPVPRNQLVYQQVEHAPTPKVERLLGEMVGGVPVPGERGAVAVGENDAAVEGGAWTGSAGRHPISLLPQTPTGDATD